MNSARRLGALLLVGAFVGLGCSSTNDSTTSTTASTSVTTAGSGGAGGSTGQGGAGGAGGSAAVELKAPVLVKLMHMSGALHAMWTNVETDCDAVEGERKTPTTDFAVIFSVPGTVNNKMDAEATDTTTAYTYRLRCKKGDAYSPYSNELTETPVP